MIQVANSKVFAKLGNGTVRDLTLDTNTVYTHPTAKQCNYAYTHPTTKQCNYSVSVINNLTSSSTTAALSANQGRILNSLLSSTAKYASDVVSHNATVQLGFAPKAVISGIISDYNRYTDKLKGILVAVNTGSGKETKSDGDPWHSVTFGATSIVFDANSSSYTIAYVAFG